MKTSVAILAAAATVAMAKPEFLNTNFDITAGEPFTLEFSGCENGCRIDLVNGDPKDLQVVQNLEEDTTSDSYVLRLSENFETDEYAFVITDIETDEVNYSAQWDFVGAEPAETSAEETSTVAETSTAEETSTEVETTSVEETTMVTVTTDTETMTTPEPSTTDTDSPSSTGSDSEETGDDSAPDDEDAAVRLGSSHVTLAAVVVAAFGYFL